MSIKKVVQLIEENEVRFVDLRFTDTKGKQQHVTVPARIVLEDPEEWFEMVKHLMVHLLAVGKAFRLLICNCVPMPLPRILTLSMMTRLW